MPSLDKLRRVRFRRPELRVLFFDSGYFLNAEIKSSAQKLGWTLERFELLDEYNDPAKFLPALLAAVDRFRPDCLLTVNHFGVDRGGGLLRLCKRIALPIASWFVDDPLLSLPFFDETENPWLTVFTYDRDSVKPLREGGYPHVHYLPLGTDTAVFNDNAAVEEQLKAHLSFVGDSKAKTVQDRIRLGKFPPSLLGAWESLAEEYLEKQVVDPVRFVTHARPDLSIDLGMIGHDRRIWYAQLVRAEAIRRHRKACLQAAVPLRPLLVGADWQGIFRGTKHLRFVEKLSYYEQLPSLYRSSTINLNISGTGRGVPNQRTFDVPACGGFLLTDNVPQLSRLYVPGEEVAVYDSPEELRVVAEKWLRDEKGRMKIVEKAMARTLAEHTYRHRLARMGEMLGRLYA